MHDATQSGIPALLAVVGLVVGAGAGRCHALGWYRRSEDPAPGRTMPALVALATGLVWWLVGRSLPLGPSPGEVTALALHLGVMTAATVAAGVDAEVRRLPDALTLPAAALVMSAFLAIRLTASGPAALDAGRALVAGVVAPALLFLAAVTIGGIGLGDVKLSCPLAALLGTHSVSAVLTGLVLAWAAAGLWSVGLLLAGRAHRSTPIPLGPFLWFGTLAGLMTG